MAKRIKALTLAVIMVLTLIAVPSGTFAVDATSSATTKPVTETPTTPTKPTTPTTPTTPTAPTAPVVTESYAIPTITRVLSSGLTGDDVILLQKYF